MITLQNTTIIEKQVIGVPQLRIYGSEGTRMAEITLPVSKPTGEPLEALTLSISWQEFPAFYANYTNDKYLIDLVFAKYGITADTSLITDFN